MEGKRHDEVGLWAGDRRAAGTPREWAMAGPHRGCGNQREPQEGRQRQRGDTRERRIFLSTKQQDRF